MRANVDQREIRAAARRFDGHDVLIFLGANLQFDIVSVVTLAGEFVRTSIIPPDVRIHIESDGMADKNTSVFRELVLENRNPLAGKSFDSYSSAITRSP